MIRTAILGAAGYAGRELAQILSWHPDAEVTYLGGLPEEAVPRLAIHHPSLANLVELPVEATNVEHIIEKADVAFLALPHTVSMNFAGPLLDAGLKVIDLSADYRLKDASLYEKWYGKKHADLAHLKAAVYGLPELFKEEVRLAKFVANPGCFPTGAVLATAPALVGRIVDTTRIIFDAKTGVSGAGRRLSIASHFAEANEDMSAYKVLSHQHAPEIEMVLSKLIGQNVAISFVPHLVPMTRGILTTTYMEMDRARDASSVIELYMRFYHEAPFVRVLKEGTSSHTKSVFGTNFCDISLFAKNGRLVVTSAIDNLVKGASGQAVQNMNLMCAFSEIAGLLPPKKGAST